jgi:hypothetical protein
MTTAVKSIGSLSSAAANCAGAPFYSTDTDLLRFEKYNSRMHHEFLKKLQITLGNNNKIFTRARNYRVPYYVTIIKKTSGYI